MVRKLKYSPSGLLEHAPSSISDLLVHIPVLGDSLLLLESIETWIRTINRLAPISLTAKRECVKRLGK